VLVSSHLLAEMELLADDLIIIANGRLVRQGTVDDVVKSSQVSVVVHVRTPQPEALVAAVTARGGYPTLLADGRIAVAGLEAAAVGNAAFTAGVELHELTTERPDLEGVFLELTQGQAAIR
jgi:ABC-2 type transport system ATP-binding protein